MYIAKVRVQNYRCFKDTAVQFQPGLNVIIGENNSGKTTLLKALSLVFNRRESRRPTCHDFHRLLEPLDKPPRIEISVTLKSSSADTDADRALVALWLTKLEKNWEAQLTYSFFLPEQDHPEFLENLGSNGDREEFFEALDESLKKFVTRIYAGNPESKVIADRESLAKFDCQFLDALRDVESEMYSGANPLFRTMLEDVLDLKTNKAERRKISKDFRKKTKILRDELIDRIDYSELFKLATATGASDGGSPKLEGGVQESDIIAALCLYIEGKQFAFPATHQGLGYNNLIYISLMLPSMPLRASNRHGENAAIFPMLLIEEPEAHLHPALQHKLLSHIVSRTETEPNDSRQVFVTTHSTHVTSAAGLEPITCLLLKPDRSVKVAYPGKLFPDTDEGRNSRGYVERYLDATKSTMLFAKGVLLVEGISELLIVPAMASLLNKPLDHHHVAIVRVDGQTFKHFLPLFGAGSTHETKEYTIDRPIACIVDADPSRKEKDVENARWKACFPFQLELDKKKYDYRKHSGVVTNLNSLLKNNKNIKVYYGHKTLEYDLAFANHNSKLLVSDEIRHADEVRKLAQKNATLSVNLEKLLKSDELEAINSNQQDTELDKYRFAAVYFKCAEDCKGEHAFAVEQVLRSAENNSAIKCPGYIKSAIEWVCREIPDRGIAK